MHLVLEVPNTIFEAKSSTVRISDTTLMYCVIFNARSSFMWQEVYQKYMVTMR